MFLFEYFLGDTTILVKFDGIVVSQPRRPR